MGVLGVVFVQMQLDEDGSVTFRYDLSRLASDDALTNVVSAVAANGRRLDLPLDRGLTSVAFARLTEDDRTNPDRDGDGVPTADELLVYGTDPSRRDTDRDGLSDFDELSVWHSDPLDANSRRTDVPDGVAVVLGDLDPFEVPPGSTNTVLEHVFYTGTTNAPFAYPAETDTLALLRVSAQGTGSGRVVVGDAVVPLVSAPSAPRMLGAPGRQGASPDSRTEHSDSQGEVGFLVQVMKGSDIRMCVYGGASFSAAYDSDEFAFGDLPYFDGAVGFINFPNTAADIPCIHDLNARKKTVALTVDDSAVALTCTWQGGSSVEVENLPPRSAAITGNFPLRETREISYTLAHPRYLFGRTTYDQIVRFCPHPRSTSDGDEDDDPSWLENDIRSMQTSTVHTVEGPLLRETSLGTIPREGIRLPLVDFQASAPSNRVMVAEAQDADCGMRLEIERDGKLLYSFHVPLNIRYVKELYSWINMRHTSDEWERRPTDIRHDAGREGRKQFIFLHGANVAEADAEIWGDQIYKRLWHSGADVDFYNVDWRSNIGLTGANYQENASNAFVVASNLAPILAAIPGEKVVMAHSLGNMVVSSMIQDHGLQVSKYLMCNSAVPAEAYDPSPALRVPQLVHPYWEDYPTNTWASCWHELFNAFPNDDRRLLGWPGRFADVAQYAVNFYSTGDEVLELAENNSIFIGTGVHEDGVPGLDFGHQSWHKQELFKGRSRATEGLGGTDWAGWGFNWDSYWGPSISDTPSSAKYDASAAAQLSSEQLMVDPVFWPNPSSMTNSVIPLLVRGAILAQGIPALAPPTGGIGLSDVLTQEDNFNLNLNSNRGGILKPNEWPFRNRYSGRWLHSDIKDVAFYYTYKFYEKVVEKGDLR